MLPVLWTSTTPPGALASVGGSAADAQVRRRRAVALAVLLAVVAGITLGARSVGGGGHAGSARQAGHANTNPAAQAVAKGHVPVPKEIRGVHVTMSLASLPGKLQKYLAMPGLNTVELDVKDEDGRVGFVPSAVPLARRIGAAAPYYKAKRAARLAHAKGIYLIGRVVTFEDPVLSEKRPELAIRTSDGSLWHTNARPRLDEPVRQARLEVQRRPRRWRR